MGALCCCFHVPQVEENVESNYSNHGNCICPNCFIQNLKFKYGALFGRVEMQAAPSGQGTAASSSSRVAPNNEQTESSRHSASNPNLSPKSGCGVNMKECHLESSNKSSRKVLMASKVGQVSPIPEEEDVCPTCLEEFTPENPKITTQCRHIYHLSCIFEWLERSDRCPICAKLMVFDETT